MHFNESKHFQTLGDHEHETRQRQSLLHHLYSYYKINRSDARLLTHPVFEQLKRDSNFDLIIFDYIINAYFVGIGAHFKCPSIAIGNNAINKPVRNLIGNPSAPAFLKSQQVEGPLRMRFLQRVQNHLFVAVEQIFLAALDRFYSQAYYEQNFPAILGYPSYQMAKRNISLVFVYSSFLQSGPILSFPSVREIGGIHVSTSGRPLPAELQAWLDDSETDVIYMSFGSLVNSSYMSADKLASFLTVFQRLAGHCRVLWKWDGPQPSDWPPNVRVARWFPQSDVLAHPKVRLFISHGGMGGISEARQHAVPVLGIPIFADQFENVERLVAEGWAKELRFIAVTEATLEAALWEMLTDARFRQCAKYASELLQDRLMHPLDEAIYWVEYVLRHSGVTDVLQSEAVNMNWFQYHSLDVFGFFVGVGFAICMLSGWMIKWVLYLWRGVSKRKS